MRENSFYSLFPQRFLRIILIIIPCYITKKLNFEKAYTFK